MVSLAARRYAPPPADRRPARAAGLHPLLSTAAIAVTVASLAVTGSAVVRAWDHANDTPVAAITPAPAAAVATVPAASAAPVQQPQVTRTYAAPTQAAPVASQARPVAVARHAVEPRASAGAAGQTGQSGQPGQAGNAGQYGHNQPVSPEPIATAPAPVPAATPASAPLPKPVVQAQAPMPAPMATVVDVREVAGVGEGTGMGAVGGGVLGAVLGSQVGKGKGRTAAGVLGALGGAYAGHEVEKRLRGKQWETTLRMDDGSTRIVTSKSAPSWRVGDKVPAEQLSRQDHAAPLDTGRAAEPASASRPWGSEA